MISEYKIDLVRYPNRYVLLRLLANLSEESVLQEVFCGIYNYKLIKESQAVFIQDKLRQMAERLLEQENIDISIYSRKNSRVLNAIKSVMEKKVKRKRAQYHLKQSWKKQSEAYKADLTVNYIVAGCSIQDVYEQNMMKYKVLCNIINQQFSNSWVYK
ncbi:hypothetical protein [Cellulosilyticum ruminicola]|uniref:hypothetical protein n=1 Tax=Cellulosilyticum ruminicola TaxID=425254 RepID=UPI0012ED8631|nr:hypothetical protein [Cellulosilyticum ruminicola]